MTWKCAFFPSFPLFLYHWEILSMQGWVDVLYVEIRAFCWVSCVCFNKCKIYVPPYFISYASSFNSRTAYAHTLIILSKFCAFQLQPRTKLFYAHPETQKHRTRKKKTTQYRMCNFSATILLQNNKHAFVLYHDHFISVH